VLVSNVVGRYPSSNFHTLMRGTPNLTVTPTGGTGGTIIPIGADGFYQNNNHSVDAIASVLADAEI
jgi:hypothetical protein